MKNRPATQSEHLPVIIIGTIVGGVALALSAVGVFKNAKAIKRLLEIRRM